jgi:cytochrome b561
MTASARGVTAVKQGSPGLKPDEEELSMKVRALGLVILTALILAVAFSGSVPAAPNTGNASAAPAPAATPNATNAAAAPEQHPQIHEAIASLRHAKEHLEHAAHDFGGHKVEAIRATDEAIRQLEICLKYDQ